MSERPVYTDAVADYCGVRPSTVVGWRRRGVGPHFTRVGNRVLYFISDVEVWLREAQTDPAENKKEKPALEKPEAPLKRPRGFDSW